MMDPHPNPAAAAAGADESTDKPSSTSEQDKKVSSSDSSPRSATDYVPYPKIDPKDVDPPPPPADGWGTFVMGSQSEHSGLPPSSLLSPGKTVHWSAELTKEAEYTNKPPPVGTMPSGRNPYISSSPATAPTAKNTMENVKDVLGKWGKKVGEATKKTEDLAGNVWQHLKTGPSVVDTAMGRIAQGTKVIAEGGYEKIFRQTFETQPEEQLRKTYACYLSTSAGPVIGTLYLSSAKLAFCSDNPLSYKVGDQTEWSYYKVVIPVHQLRSVNSSASKTNSAEKYIQVASVDNHEFWFMGFVNYDSAVKYLQDVVKGQTSEAV